MIVTDDWKVNTADIQGMGMDRVELGRGSFGVVYKAKLHGMDVAIKRIETNVSATKKKLAVGFAAVPSVLREPGGAENHANV